MRHANADTVTVSLTEKDDNLILRIEDNGKGIKEENIPIAKSLGILGMRERARQIGGELRIFKGEESGTTVLLTVPMV
jgi:signal transduction histidine kinase